MDFSDLEIVNSKVNLFQYKTDADKYGKADFWEEITSSGGDCEDAAIAKLHRLLALGWPINSMRLACCYCENGEYHAVLLVNFDGQTWVLDNRHPYPMEFQMLPYMWDRIQIAGTREWEMV